MATNGVNNAEDADMAECDGEKIVTMMDVLQEEQDFEDDANAVLGASDEKNCTYSKGYIKRQAIYACLTCCSEAKSNPTKRAGVCLACSLNCHENHDLVELYTKRNFRCDCGNPKFNSHPCTFTLDKPDFNEDNNYNQNFSGLYCTCQRPYPDPESTVEDDEMIQCIVCEDWLHASHIEATVPGVDLYSEMICKACMENNTFLHDYSQLAVNIETTDVDVVGINGDIQVSNGNATENVGNGTSMDNTKNLMNDSMDVDEPQIENKDSTDNGDSTANLRSLVESKDSNDSIIAAENTENAVSSETSSNSKHESTTILSSEENTKPCADSLEDAKETTDKVVDENSTPYENSNIAAETAVAPESEPQKPKENSESANEAKDIPESENIDELEKKVEEDNVESGNMEENIDPPNKENEAEEMTDKSDALKIESSNVNTNEVDATEATENSDDTKEKNDKQTNDFIKESSDTDVHEDDTTIKADTDAANEADTDAVNKTDTNDVNKTTESENIPSEDNSENKDESSITPCEINVEENSEVKIEECNDKTEDNKDNKRKLSTEEATESDEHLIKKPRISEESSCIRPKGVKRVHKGATFWPSNFRQKLCTCSECLSMYKDLSVLFLIDPEDTVFAYEALGKERVNGRATQYEKGLEALSSLDRIQQINALTEYNKMKDKLLDFLKSFMDRKEIVKEEDIKAFFAGMKPKREPDGVYFCR